MSTPMSVLFIDRDGTLIKEPADEQVDRIDKVALVENVMPALRELIAAGFRLVLVSNQDGLGSDRFPQSDFDAPHDFMLSLFASQGITFDEQFICPHLPDERCGCRKPRTGLLTTYLASNTLDLSRCAVIGDRRSDMDLATALGVRGFQIDADMGWLDIAHELVTQPRRAERCRTTNETRILARVDLDAVSPQRIQTGLGFLDHMLEQLGKHGGFALMLDCQGDLHIDDHHSVEDIAITLGEALKAALGNKSGIGRYGFVLPMDETQASATVDLSGRPAFKMNWQPTREQVGGIAVEMFPHFFLSLSQALGAAIHLQVSGENMHHQVEACFKAVGRALRPALARSGTELPSTKGLL
ncbi:MAG: bifunctional histidinol-phosphatase/imidazoleglycerol-phosphate dehydratase HisB [Pseudomonadota bacterium]